MIIKGAQSVRTSEFWQMAVVFESQPPFYNKNLIHMYNPFTQLCSEEKALAYCRFSDTGDKEAMRMIEDALDDDVYVDLREFKISTRDY